MHTIPLTRHHHKLWLIPWLIAVATTMKHSSSVSSEPIFLKLHKPGTMESMDIDQPQPTPSQKINTVDIQQNNLHIVPMPSSHLTEPAECDVFTEEQNLDMDVSSSMAIEFLIKQPAPYWPLLLQAVDGALTREAIAQMLNKMPGLTQELKEVWNKKECNSYVSSVCLLCLAQ